MTAYKIALNVITLGSDPNACKVLPRGIVEATEKLLLAAEVVPETWIRWARAKWMPDIYRSLDWVLPGMYISIAHRKAFYDRQVRTAIESGATQVLIIGAGYDTLGWRLSPEFAHVHFFEVEHPATSRLKLRGIEALGKRENLHLVQADLSEMKLVDVIRAIDIWRPAEKTMIMAEGFLMYLPEKAVRDLFKDCYAVAGKDSRIVFDYLSTGDDGRFDVGRWAEPFMWMIKLLGEPWRWGIQPDKLDNFLMALGWKNRPELVGRSEKCGIEFLGVATK